MAENEIKNELKEEETTDTYVEEISEEAEKETEKVDEEEVAVAEEEEIDSEMAKKVEELENQCKRLSADFQNYKKRIEKEREGIKYLALEKFVLNLLPTLDNFERALEHANEDDALYEGVNMIYDNMIKTFEDNKIIQINPLGEDFDPAFHQAIAMDSTSEYEKGKVTEVLLKGYILNGKVIRAAAVKVAE